MSGKKRIAFLGGGVLVIPNTLVLLEQLGQYHDITVYSDFHITVAPNACYKVKTVPPPKLYRKFKNALFAWMVWKDLIGKRIDLIHAHSTFPNGFWGIVIGRLLRIPVIVSMDAGEAIGLPDIGFGDLLNPRRAFINKWVLRRATRILVPSQFHLQHVRDNLRISGPIRVIIRGVDTATFRFSERPIAQKIIFLNVAYLHPVKDQETLLKCFKLLSAEKDSELIHIGKDYADGYYQQLAREMGIANRVSFLGFIPNQDLPAYYAKADILLHTSRFEGQAVVINEAMACGLVVCGTEVGILSDLSGTCCITVPTQDAEGLADSVLALLENETELKRLRTNARQWTLGHNLGHTVEEHLEVYASVTASNQAKPEHSV